MTIALTIYAAIGLVLGTMIVWHAWDTGRVRWYQALAGIVFWPIVLYGGLYAAWRDLKS